MTRAFDLAPYVVGLLAGLIVGRFLPSEPFWTLVLVIFAVAIVVAFAIEVFRVIATRAR